MASVAEGQSSHLPTKAISTTTTPPDRAQPGTQDGPILNHVAIKVTSVAASKAFYADILGMKELFTINTGRFTAHYLGSSFSSEESSKDILASLGTRSGLLELIHKEKHATDAVRDSTWSSEKAGFDLVAPKERQGFVHLGYRVPDVAATLERARQGGWQILKDINEISVSEGVLPGRSTKAQPLGEWTPGFLHTLAQIGFVADPDG